MVRSARNAPLPFSAQRIIARCFSMLIRRACCEFSTHARLIQRQPTVNPLGRGSGSPDGPTVAIANGAGAEAGLNILRRNITWESWQEGQRGLSLRPVTNQKLDDLYFKAGRSVRDCVASLQESFRRLPPFGLDGAPGLFEPPRFLPGFRRESERLSCLRWAWKFFRLVTQASCV